MGPARYLPLAGKRNPRRTVARTVVAVLAGAVLVLPCLETLAVAQPAAVSAKSAKPKKLSARQRATIKRGLQRTLKRSPASVFERSFVRKAGLVDFKLPLTVRLNKAAAGGGFEASDDVLEIQWDTSLEPWPLGPLGTMPATQDMSVDGYFTMEADYGGDTTGYGELGAMETAQGMGLAMTGTPITISEFATSCPDGPQVFVPSGDQVAISSVQPRFGLVNYYTNQLRGSLALRMTFATQAAASCGATPGAPQTVDNTAQPPMPVYFSGSFRMSPGITSDGHVRFGVLSVDDSVTAQTTTFGYVRACTGQTACDPVPFPARLKFKKLTAEVLLGDAVS
jgi:hypothetical protein